MALELDAMRDQRIPIMMSEEEVEKIDEYRSKLPAPTPSRSEAIRRLVELGLKAKGK